MLIAQVNRGFIFCLLQIFFAIYAYAQEPVMKHYTVNDGLASGTVYGMLNDSKGFLWFCTEDGVSRFDGHKFTNITLADGLSDNEMLRVYEDAGGRIWFLGFNGTLSYYFNEKFFNPLNDTVLKKAESKTSFRNFFEDKWHRLWFTADREYIMIDGKKVRNIDPARNKILPEGIIMNSSGKGVYLLTSMGQYTDPLHLILDDKNIPYKVRYTQLSTKGFCYLHDGGILFQAKEGLVMQKDTMQELVLPLGKEFEHVIVNSIFIDKQDRLWITTHGKGVFCYDYKDFSKPPEKYLSNSTTCNVHEDMEGNIWMTTMGDGVYMLPRGYKSIRNYNADNGLEDNKVFSVAKDSSGNIYAGMDNGSIAIINKGVVKTLLPSENAIRYNRVIKIITRGKYLWVASNDYLIYIERKNNVPDKLYFINENKDVRKVGGVKDMSLYNDTVAVCVSHHLCQGNAFGRSPLRNITHENRRSYCVYTNHKGIIWYGAQGGLYSYNNGVNTHHTLDNMDQETRINSIAETGDSVLIIATYGQGVYLYKNDSILEHLTVQNGLSSDICKRVFVYKDDIFVATANGATLIKYYKGKSLSIKKYTTADGLLSNDVKDIFADNNDICIATSEGLSVVGRNAAANFLVAPPPVYISAIQNQGQPLHPDSNYIFPYMQNAFHFDFIAISYQNARDIRYQYRLDEAQPWLETGNTSLDFPAMQPASYHFQLRARILSGPWSNSRSFYFIIKPPIWKTTWFWTICAISFIILVIMIARYQVNATKRKQQDELKIKDQVAHLEQQALQAMMNPHFIFNVMNSIQHYINNNEKHEANVYLSNFASLIRMNLDISSKRYIPLDEETAYLQLYLSLESLRFGQRLTYKIDVDPAIDGDETMIPVMLIQPFIENAIWHGILPKKENGHVQVSINKQKDGMLNIQIMDDGVGMPGTLENKEAGIKSHISKGMKMTQQRLDLISKITGHALYIHILDAFPGEKYKGTKVEILLPGDLL